ncbi:NAD(P)/FAD-dependent oxidoreductase [Nannocystis sp.]|uniref:NAD(P)/FAD-dependent oxidoreductase n=1 Tax=Nannocystis sp. TaxID=1962667 RepID=UPI0025D09E16|nr:NAD(P)/FAD-dependent oxidoreductase [Nannocystis sp.]MBK7828862.1 NAD(P)/FAD-dependent oxidoreductase [Nannocystis sp.]
MPGPANAPPARHVVIVGGGFGGLCAAQVLAGAKGVEVTIIDRRNHHLFQPLLYQVAMAGLSPAEIAYPIRTIFSGKRNVRVLLARATGIDLGKKLLRTDDAEIPYDNLILACGARQSYFGHNEWETYAPGLKSLEEATEIRRRVLTAFELAEKEPDPDKQRKLLTFVVIGGGPTGVELAGALGEISRFTLSRDFRRIDPRRTRVILIEAGPRILAAFDEKLASRATADLESLGVTVWTSTKVTRVDADGVDLGEESVQAATILWAAGVAPSELNKSLGVPLDRGGRVMVEQDCSLKDHPEVFVVGDQAHFLHNDKPLPGLAPVAMQQGRCTARNILREVKGKPREPFRYRDKGQMATIGRRRAIVEFGRFKFAGFFAWLAWLLVHILYLVGFKNRLEVVLNWSWNYFAFSRGARLIVGKDWRSAAGPAPAPRAVVEEPSGTTAAPPAPVAAPAAVPVA